MTIVLSILLAAIVGGIVFMLLDGWQRKRVTPAVAAPPPADSPIWTPEARAPAYALPPRPTWMPPDAETKPLPPPPVWTPEAETKPPPRPLWTPPPAGAHWDDDGRDEDDSPPGLWSGWARR